MTNKATNLAWLIAPFAAAHFQKQLDDLFSLASNNVKHNTFTIGGGNKEPLIAWADGIGKEFTPLHIVSRVHLQNGARIRHQVRAVRLWHHYHCVQWRVQMQDSLNGL